MSSTTRLRRRFALAGVTLACAVVPTGDAMAAAVFELGASSSQHIDGQVDNTLYAAVYGTEADVPGALRVLVTRGGAPVFDQTGNRYAGDGYASSSLFDEQFGPAAGD